MMGQQGGMMTYVETIPRGVPSKHIDNFILTNQHNILKSCCFIWQYRSIALLACNHFEVDEMNMDWMRPAPTMILESPQLNSTSRRPGEDAIVDIGEGNAVDCPLTVPVKETVSNRQTDGEESPHFRSKLKMWSGLDRSLG